MKWAWLGMVAYRDALEAMERVAVEIAQGREPGRALFLEHPPTVTLGRRATENALKVSVALLAEMGVCLERADRGGEATYHGPGQLVVYPVVSLRALGVGVGEYVGGLLEAVRRVLARFGIENARCDMERPGVWTPRGKIAAIGLRVRRHVATHGLAINISVEKHRFDLIVPCGIEGAQVASMSDFISPPTSREVSEALAEKLGEVFGRPVLEEDAGILLSHSVKEVAIA